MKESIDQTNLTITNNDIFFREHEEEINNLINTLMDFRLNTETKYKDQLKNILNSLKQKSVRSGYQELINMLKHYEEYLDSIRNIESNSHEVFSELLKKTGMIKHHVYQLKSQNSKNKTENLIKIDKYSSYKEEKNLLLLDDDILISTILKDAFEAQGYNVITTTDPHEAIEYILYKNINIALIDVVMPKLNGFEVFEILKRNGVDIPIIFLSGRSMIDYKVKALSKGVDDYITKPFEIQEVIARVERSLGRTIEYRDKLTIDDLTGSYNKEYFNEKISEILSNEEYIKNNCSVAFIDLDDFKDINDTYGHIIGDYILRDFSNFMRIHLDESDMIFRFGGDEFIIIFINKNVSDAYFDIENMREGLNEIKFKYKDVRIPIGLSISSGVTQIESDDSVEELLDRADKCLYKSKKLGKNMTMSTTSINKQVN